MMKRILITGANGYIGQVLLSTLHEENYSLRTAGRNLQDDDSKENRIVNDYVVFDLDDKNYNYDKLLDGVDVIIHLASRVHRINGQDDALEAYRKTNYLGVEKFAKEAAKREVQRFIFLSSIKVNGEKNISNKKGEVLAFNESNDLCPQGAYATSKLDAEIAIRKICRESKMDFVILRPTLVYGPGVTANFLSLLEAVDKKYLLPLASVKNKRSLLYVGNLGHAIFTCIERSEAANKTYLISDVDISVPELIKKIAYHMEKNTMLFHCPVALLKLLAGMVGKQSLINRITDSLLVDSSRFRRELNWTPPYSLDEGIRETVSWYCNRE